MVYTWPGWPAKDADHLHAQATVAVRNAAQAPTRSQFCIVLDSRSLSRPRRGTQSALAGEAENRRLGIPPAIARSNPGRLTASPLSFLAFGGNVTPMCQIGQELAVTWPNGTFVPRKPQNLLLLG